MPSPGAIACFFGEPPATAKRVPLVPGEAVPFLIWPHVAYPPPPPPTSTSR